jgi:AraC-like DNA-binding protein
MKELLEKYNCDITKDSVWIHSMPTDTAKSTFFYVQETGFFKCRSRYFTERENQDSFLVSYTLSGEGSLTYKGECFKVQPGQAFFINCSDHHLYKTASKRGWNICWVHFNGSNAPNYHDLFMKNGSPVVEIQNGEEFSENIFKIISQQEKFNVETELVCSSLIMQILTELLRSAPVGLSPVSDMPEYIKQIVTHIDKNFAENISLDDLSSQYQVSKYHLSREFKKYIGVSIHEYQIKLRINLSKALLTSSLLSVSDISRMVGIDHISHFISLFKKRVNDTPLSYRKKWHHLD